MKPNIYHYHEDYKSVKSIWRGLLWSALAGVGIALIIFLVIYLILEGVMT